MKRKEFKHQNLFSLLALFSFVVFTISQLTINSVLTPLGIKLERLNTEKEHLLEENRNMSEEIAKSSSIKVIENLSVKKLKLSQEMEQTFIYIEDPTLVANK
jgi:hypothetical protein